MRSRVGAFVATMCFVAHACSLDGLEGGRAPGADAGADASADAASDAEPCPGCEVVVANESTPTEILVAGGELYWIRRGAVGAVAKSALDGSGVTYEPEWPLVDGHDLAWSKIGTTGVGVFAIGADGVVHRYLSFSTCDGGQGMTHISRLGDDLVFANASGISGGGCGNVSPLLAENVAGVLGDAPYLWFGRASGDVARCDATSATSCAGSIEVLARAQGRVDSLAHDDTYVAWIAPGPPMQIRALRRTDAGGSATPIVVASDLDEPKSILLVDGDVVFTDAGRGTVSRAPARGGGSPRVVASGLERPWGLAAASPWLYVTESSAGRIRRLPL